MYPAMFSFPSLSTLGFFRPNVIDPHLTPTPDLPIACATLGPELAECNILKNKNPQIDEDSFSCKEHFPNPKQPVSPNHRRSMNCNRPPPPPPGEPTHPSKQGQHDAAHRACTIHHAPYPQHAKKTHRYSQPPIYPNDFMIPFPKECLRMFSRFLQPRTQRAAALQGVK